MNVGRQRTVEAALDGIQLCTYVEGLEEEGSPLLGQNLSRGTGDD